MSATPPATPPHPHIRSFSGRRGHFTSGQRHAYETLRERWCVPYDAGQVLDAPRLARLFGRSAPLVVEIGFGMGDATAQIAAAQPQHDFLGIEVYPAGVGALLIRIDAQRLSNVRIVQHDAVEVLRDMVAPDSLARVQVFFPDPWPKKRHHKRRLLQAPFAALLASRLRPGAILHCATDWEPYAEQMLEVLSSEPLLQNAADDARFASRPAYRPLTRFENRGRKLGHVVRDLVFRRVTRSSAPVPTTR
ncbi:MAG: tRNA (guanosine(46)-N7)-methyltransferase TrmB [Burkholderiaceae bacterium]|nr:tRNA (guanosine(46)-N7)-methyltransferase TrmB [Burkholderiaceae bacterium]